MHELELHQVAESFIEELEDKENNVVMLRVPGGCLYIIKAWGEVISHFVANDDEFLDVEERKAGF